MPQLNSISELIVARWITSLYLIFDIRVIVLLIYFFEIEKETKMS